MPAIVDDHAGIARELHKLRTGRDPAGAIHPALAELRLLSEMQRRRDCRRSFAAWCTEALAPFGQAPAAHHRLLIAELQAVADGAVDGAADRLMVLMPPGSAKSTYVSTLFPAWWFAVHPRSAIIGASHTAELADRFGRRVRNAVVEHAVTLGYGLAADNKAAGRWETSGGGEYFAVGVGGAVTGRRGDLIIIDDPVRSRAEVESQLNRDSIWEWYRSALYTRLLPGGRIVLVMTRWHEDDLGGRLLQEAAIGGDKWRVLCLPALALADDPLGRTIGEPLWPEFEDADALARKRAAIGERDWSALFQQQPRPNEGALFHILRVGIIDAEPAGCRAVRAWDLAATKQTGTRDPDWTVGIKLLRTPQDRYVVADRVRLRGGPDEVEAAIVNTAKFDGKRVAISLPQDPGQAGKVQALYYARKLSGHTVHISPETGDKATRAAPVASQCNVENLSLVKGDWNRSFLDELAAFPSGAKDDQVDALSRAFAYIGNRAGIMAISDEAIRRAGMLSRRAR